MPVVSDKPMSLRAIRRRLIFLSNLDRELQPAELAEYRSLRLILRRELFSRLSLEKR